MARKRRSLSFLERNQRIVGAIALFLIVVGTALALLLQGGLLTPTYRVTALFPDAAGVRAGDRVTVAGLQAGTVKDVAIDGGMVAIELGVEEGIELPRDSRAEIVVETLLGRQSVALIPGRSDSLLRHGDLIPPERTTTPIDVTELNDISVDLLEASDADALETFMDEVSEVTGDSVEEVQALISGLKDVTAAVDSRSRELATLLALHQDLQILDRHQLDLAAGIAYLENAVQGYSSVGYSQNRPNHWANIFVQQLGPAGVDALVGKCGLVDQLFDHYFAADCEESTTPPPTPGVTSEEAQTTGILAPPEPPELVELPALPCSIGDVVDRAL